MRKWQIFKSVIAIAYSLAVTFMAGKWAFDYAYMERGYEAIGGEYLFVPMAAWVAYKVISIFLDTLEEEIYATDTRRKKRGGRGIPRL